YVKTLTIEAIAFSYTPYYVHAPLLKEFNKYSKENNLGIHVNLNLLTTANSTELIGDYGTTVEIMLKRKDGKYDLVFYDNVYPIRYGPYLVDLKTLLPPGHVEMYADSIASETCVFEDKWVGLPLEIDYNGLYVNDELLKEYDKRVPETWDELIETAEYILDEEKKKDPEVDLTAYNGMIDGTYC
ncbi:hypothetical protein PIROE2DRAFT_16031, partial [Piromyces sp. E2]